jgi:hypothetical protein
MIWTSRAALGAGGRSGTDRVIHRRDEEPHRAKTMSNIPPSRSPSPRAQRMRHYRKQRRQGLRSVRILLHETDIDALIRMGLLKEDQRHDVEALQTAVTGLLYRAEDDLA